MLIFLLSFGLNHSKQQCISLICCLPQFYNLVYHLSCYTINNLTIQFFNPLVVLAFLTFVPITSINLTSTLPSVFFLVIVKLNLVISACIHQEDCMYLGMFSLILMSFLILLYFLLLLLFLLCHRLFNHMGFLLPF